MKALVSVTHQLVEPRDFEQQQDALPPIPTGRYTSSRVSSCIDGVGDPSKGAARSRIDRQEVRPHGLPPRATVPVLAVGHGLPGVQRGGVAQLGPVAHRGVDVDDRRLADHRVLPDGDRAHVDETRRVLDSR